MLDEWNITIHPPASWQDFEALCWDLFGQVLGLSETKRYGRQGQGQNGVDIIGKSERYDGWVGLQCKQKETYPEKCLTKTQILEEVEKAKLFRPLIAHYIILTTASRDAKLQSCAMEISDQNQASGIFSVEIYFWDDIMDLLRKNPDVLRRHYDSAKNADIIQEIEENSKYESEKICTTIKSEIDHCITSLTPSIIDPALSNEYKEELSPIKKEIEDHHPSTALRLLDSFKERVWSRASNEIKYQILNYKGQAKIQLHEYSSGGRLLIEALQYNPDDESAIGNAAQGYFLLNEYDKTIELASKIIQKNPVSSRGYSLLIQARGRRENVDIILREVPDHLLRTPEVAGVIGEYFYNIGNFEEAVHWLQIALETSEKNPHDVKILLASAAYHLVEKDPTALSGSQLSEQHKKLLNSAITLFGEVIHTTVDDRELQKASIDLFIEMAEAKSLLGLKTDAAKDIDQAYHLDGKNPRILYLKGWYAFQANEYKEAEHFFEQIIWTDLFSPTALELYLETLRRMGRFEEGLGKITSFREHELTQDQEKSLNHAYIAFNISRGQDCYKNAEDFALSRFHEDSKNIDKLLDLIRVMGDIGKLEDADLYLDKIRELFSESLPPLKQLEIADIYFAFKRYDDAAEIYRQHINPKLNSTLTPKLVASYYFGGKHRAALELCQTIDAIYGPLPSTADIELEIYDEVGDLPKAKNLCETYLNIFPEDYRMRLNLSSINVKIGALSSVDEFLSQPYDFDALSYSSGSKLVQLLYLRGRFDEALDLAYRLLKKFYDLPEAHLDYFWISLKTEDKTSYPFKPEIVGLNTSVYVKDQFGDVQAYTIEELDSRNRLEHDLHPNDPLAKLLLGKSKGSKIILPDDYDIGTEESLTITGICSKYSHAFQKIGSSFSQKFPHYRGGPRRRRATNTEDGGLDPELLRTITAEVSKRSKEVNRVLDIYKQGSVPIETLSHHLDTTIFSVWSLLTQVPELGIRCSLAITGEHQKTISENENPTIILDPIALITIQSLHIGDLLVERYGKLGIAQSTVDLIQQAILEHTGVKRQAQLDQSVDSDALKMHEISAEVIQKERASLENLLQWVHVNCAVIPCYPALDIDPAEKERYNILIGKASIESILLATKPGYLLYSDDRVIHAVAKEKFKLSSTISTPDIIRDCLHASVITREKYSKMALQLIAWNYRPVPIDAELILEAAEKAGWDLVSPFTDVIEALHSICYPNGANRFAPVLKFTELLWGKPIEEEDRNVLFLRFLTAVAPEGDTHSFVGALGYLISIHPSLSSDNKEQILENIETWKLIFPKRMGSDTEE